MQTLDEIIETKRQQVDDAFWMWVAADILIAPRKVLGYNWLTVPRELTEDDKAIHRAIKHHQP